MNKIEKMILELDKETQFDITNMDSVLVRLPMLYNKFLGEWFNASRAIDKLEIEMSNMYAELFGYYRVHYEIDLTTAEVKAMIENNTDRNKIKEKLSAAKTYVSFIEKAMQSITDTKWGIKNLLEYHQFVNGSK